MVNKKTTTIKESSKQRREQIISEAGAEVQNTITLTSYMNVRAKATNDLKSIRYFYNE